MELASALQRVTPILRKSEIGKVSSRILMVSLLLDLRMMAEAGLGEPGQLPWGTGLPKKNEPVQNATAGTHSQPVETLELR